MSEIFKFSGMKKSPNMSFIEILKKRLERKKQELKDIETVLASGGVTTAVENRKFVELKAVIQEIENTLDLAETMLAD